MYRSLWVTTNRNGFKFLHGGLQVYNICCWVSSSIILGMIEKFTRQALTRTINQLCWSAVNVLLEGYLDAPNGRESAQWVGLGWHLRAAFSWQCRRSMKPSVIGWYAVVWIRLYPKSCIKSANSNWDTKLRNPSANESTSHHLCCYVSDLNGFWPVSETIIASKKVGVDVVKPGIYGCQWSNRCTFVLWHCRQDFAHLRTLELIPNLVVTNFCVVWVPGWESEDGWIHHILCCCHLT